MEWTTCACNKDRTVEQCFKYGDKSYCQFCAIKALKSGEIKTAPKEGKEEDTNPFPEASSVFVGRDDESVIGKWTDTEKCIAAAIKGVYLNDIRAPKGERRQNGILIGLSESELKDVAGMSKVKMKLMARNFKINMYSNYRMGISWTDAKKV